MVSDVWEYCTRVSDTLVKCNHCGKIMSFHGTTNIRVHVGRHFGMKPTRCRSTARLPRRTLEKQKQKKTAILDYTIFCLFVAVQPGQQLQSPASSPVPVIQKSVSPPQPVTKKPMPAAQPIPKATIVKEPKQPAKIAPKPVPQPQPPAEVCLRWNSYHSNMQNTFPSLLNNEQFVDVTLACDGRSIKCHKVGRKFVGCFF